MDLGGIGNYAQTQRKDQRQSNYECSSFLHIKITPSLSI